MVTEDRLEDLLEVILERSLLEAISFEGNEADNLGFGSSFRRSQCLNQSGAFSEGKESPRARRSEVHRIEPVVTFIAGTYRGVVDPSGLQHGKSFRCSVW